MEGEDGNTCWTDNIPQRNPYANFFKVTLYRLEVASDYLGRTTSITSYEVPEATIWLQNVGFLA